MRLHNRSVRQDVRELGALLGDVLETSTSASAFEVVESLRTAAIAYRRGNADSRTELHATLARLDPALESVVARAFTSYFELINLAEERERVRELRSREQRGTLAEGIEAAMDELGSADVATVERVFDDVVVEPTFTAHPTEARRKTIKAKLRSVAETLEALDERRLTDDDRADLERALEAEVASLWDTRQVRQRRPEPTDEVRNVHWYFENTLFDAVADVYRSFERALDGTGLEADDLPTVLRFRSWAGSDRDGNPYVTPEVTAFTLERQRRIVLSTYREALEALGSALSHDGDRVDVTPAFEAGLAADRERLPSVAEALAERSPGEPYRQKLALMIERLDRVDDVRPGGYADADGFVADLDGVAGSLRAGGAEAVASHFVDPLRHQARTFGFHLAGLDLRDHRRKHTDAVAAALGREGIDYGELDEDGRVELLTAAVLQDEAVVDVSEREGLADEAARVLELFDSLADWQAEFGEAAVDTYCISMTERPSHVLEVLFLADQAGVVSLPDHSGIDVVPLLETESALGAAREITASLFENEAYAAHLEARGHSQEVMLGYSDSNKENGYLAANWSLHRNQLRLAESSAAHDVDLRLFHGRGGSISRGGGPMNRALLALPDATVTGPVKFTEQGEAIAEKYANPRIAERNLEQMLNAQLRARLRVIDGAHEEVPEAWIDAMDEMAEAAREAYRDLLGTEGFLEYFEAATPITVIEDLNLGSRPASRTGERTVEDLRAIPWVFSWTQSRCILPGWFGVGRGLEAYLEDGGEIETLRNLYDDWAFFRTTLDNAALALARTDLEIAAEYAHLAPDDVRSEFVGRIEAEYDRAAELVPRVAGRDRLVARDWLQESLHRRNPYVDPLNLLQAHLLGQTHLTDEEERTLRLTVKGIAAGMKNTG